jgi:Tfp pilus assembly protein PilX
MEKRAQEYSQKCRGAVLLLALVFTLMLAVIAASVMQTAILQLHMAGNDQFLEEAIHRAEAIITELSLNRENFSLTGGVGDTNCPIEAQGLICDRNELAISRLAQTPEGLEVDYWVTRQDPLMRRSFTIRESQDIVSSSTHFGAATFEINVRIGGGENRLGNAHIVQGIAVRVPTPR